MNKAEHTKLIYSGKYPLPLDTATKKSYKILIYRSLIPSGIIEQIDLPELPENYHIIRGKDLKNRNNFKLNRVRIPILASEKVNYIGEPILIILGSEMVVLKSIYKKISIIYKRTENAVEEIFYSRTVEIGNHNEDTVIPHKTTSGTIKTPNRAVCNKSLHGSFTKRDSDTLINYSSTLWESHLRDNIAHICGINSSRIKIITPTITGETEHPILDSFRSSFFTAISASIIKKNVLYSPTPEDQFLFSSKIYGLLVDWKIKYNIDNKVIGIVLNVTLNCGAYPIFVKEKVLRIIHGLTSFYKHRNIIMNVKAIKSNLPPGGVSEGLYLSDALFVSELITGRIIEESGQDQLKWRVNNLLKKGYKNSSNTIIKRDLPLDIMLKNIAIQSDFSRKNSSINLALLRREKRIHHSSKRGIGISVGYNGNGFISNEKDISTSSVTLQLNRDGKADLRVSCRISNLEILNHWEGIIKDILDIEDNAITIYSEDSSKVDDSGPNFENKNITTITPLIRQCCEEIKERRFKDPLPIKQSKITRRTSSMVWNQKLWKGEPFKNSSYAVCAVEVEIDKRSLSCIIKEIWLNIEVGQVLNKNSLMNSLHREIASTIEWLQEPEPILNEGMFSTDNFYNKTIVKSTPLINISIYETGKNKNIPKGAGSLIKNCLPGAYIQGLNQAIGSNINTFPVTRDMIYRELIKYEV